MPSDPVSLVSLDSLLIRDMDKLMTLKRVTDLDGHKWPITGHKCTICKWPLIPVGESATHPNCEQETTK